MTSRPHSVHFYTFDHWKDIIEDWKKSGLSVEDYCKEKNIGQETFKNWQKEITDINSPQEELKDSQASISDENDPPLPLSNGHQLQFQGAPQFRTAKEWKDIIDDWKKSGLSKNAYCTQNDIGRTAFGRWLKKCSDPELYKRALERELSGRDRYTPEQWKEIIEDWKNSGLSVEAYCKQKGIVVSAFWRWKQKIICSSSYQQSFKAFQDSNSHSSLQENMSPSRFSLAGPPKFRSKSQRFYTTEQKQGFVEEWKKSGLPMDTYSRQKDLPRTSFYYWVQELKRLESSPQTHNPSHKPLSSSSRFYTPEQKQKFIEEWKKSGLSRDAFARQKGLNHSTFWDWEMKSRLLEFSSSSSNSLQKQKTKSSFEEHFIPVTLKPSPFINSSNVSSKVEVTLSQGDHLSIEGPFEWESLISLLTSLLRR